MTPFACVSVPEVLAAGDMMILERAETWCRAFERFASDDWHTLPKRHVGRRPQSVTYFYRHEERRLEVYADFLRRRMQVVMDGKGMTIEPEHAARWMFYV